MALAPWQLKSAQAARQSFDAANQRRSDLLNPQPQQITPGVTSGLTGLVNNYNTAYGAAKGENEARYQQMLGIADQTTNQRQTDVQSAYNQQQSDAMQQLARLGMANTTVAPTMKMGVEREKQSALNRVADEMQKTKLGIIERRTDAYPDSKAIVESLKSLGTGYGSQGVEAIIKALSGMKM